MSERCEATTPAGPHPRLRRRAVRALERNPALTVVRDAYFGYVYMAVGEKEPRGASRGGDGDAPHGEAA